MLQPLVHSCVVPCRRLSGQVEFCLVRDGRDNRWDFPAAVVSDGECHKTLALRQAEAAAGLLGELDDTPLGEFASSRGDLAHSFVAFLMLVTNGDEDTVQI